MTVAAFGPTRFLQMYPVPTVGVSLLAKAFCQAAGFFLTEYISVPAVTASSGSALTAGHLFQTPKR